MKTVFISAFHPYTFRNILASEALTELVKKEDIRLVVFVFDYKKEYFQKQFSSPKVIIEGISLSAPSKKLGSLLMKRIAKYGLTTNSTKIERRIKLCLEKKFFYFLAISFVGILLGKIPLLSPLLRRLMRWVDYRLATKNRYRAYFEKYHPDLVLITDIQNERDIEIVHNAKNLKVPILGLVRSWDNLTLHGLIRALSDRLVVSGPLVKEQAILYHDLKPEKVEVIGIVHYDKYFAGATMPKERFLESVGLNSGRRTIFYALIGDFYIPNNDTDSYIVDILRKVEAQTICRFSPTLSVKKLEHVRSSRDMVFDRPGTIFEGRGSGGKELTSKDDDRLLNSLCWSDLIICGPSSIALDSIFLDKPVILIDFHPAKRKYLESLSRRYDYTHFNFLVKNQAAKIARSKEELLEKIEEYFKNPSENSEGREIVRRAYIGPLDGKSGQRLARIILQMLN